jgi:hypothetical protein
LLKSFPPRPFQKLSRIYIVRFGRNRVAAELKGERNCNGFLRQTKIKIEACSNATIGIFIFVCRKKTRKAAAS